MKKLFVFLLSFFAILLASCDINITNNNNNNASTDKKEDAIYSFEVSPQLSISSIDKVNYSIENVCDNVDDCSIQILDSKENIVVVYDKLSGSIRELNKNEEYVFTGYYLGYIGNKLYKVNIKPTKIDTTGYDSVLKIQKNNCVSNVFSNLFVIDTKPFVDASPEGYSFAGISVTEKDGNTKDFDYNNQTRICVENIKPNTTYLVSPYYDEITKAKSKISYNIADVTSGYRIKFVGFWVVSGDKNANKVDMVYKDEILYTYYVADGGSIYNPYNFMLPQKYKNYVIVGSDKALENITSDMVCNLVLADKNAASIFLVVFYDLKGNIFHSEYVEAGKAANGPNKTPESYTVGSITYEFDKWDKEYINVTENMHIYPIKKDNRPKEEIPVIEYDNTLISNKYLSGGYNTKSGGASIISTKVYLKDSTGNIYNIVTEKVINESYLVEYDSSKTYELYTQIEYKLDTMTESAYITKVQHIDYSKINSYDQGNYSFDAAFETNRSMHVKVRYDDIDMLVRYIKVNDYYSYFSEFAVEDNLAIVDGLYPGCNYVLNYAFKDNTDELLYYVSNSTFEIETLSKAEFGLEEVSIEYTKSNSMTQEIVKIKFVGEKAEEYLAILDGFHINATIIENSEKVAVQILSNEIETGVDEYGNKYAFVYARVDARNYETGDLYMYNISQITLIIEDEVFYYFGEDYKATENGYIDYFEYDDYLEW